MVHSIKGSFRFRNVTHVDNPLSVFPRSTLKVDLFRRKPNCLIERRSIEWKWLYCCYVLRPFHTFAYGRYRYGPITVTVVRIRVFKQCHCLCWFKCRNCSRTKLSITGFNSENFTSVFDWNRSTTSFLPKRCPSLCPIVEKRLLKISTTDVR
mgnify:CR=1 FL=1